MANQLVAGDALLVVDVQNDFLPGGKLAVDAGDAVVPALNRYLGLAKKLGLPVYASRDWHPPRHCSFAAQGGPWPEHCVAGSPGAQFAPGFNLLHFETTVASKAARSVLVAPGKLLVDFGLRRAHGAEAGLLAARASYIAGFSGTATVLAAPLFRIPLFGTMAHSFVQAHDDEAAAFVEFAKVFPGNTVLLIDTYDTESAARKIVALAPQLQQAGVAIKGVRLDSGDLAVHARNVRRILDGAGLTRTTIFASGNLDEYRVRELLAAGAPIDGFGIGTSMATASDAPFLDAVYKLEEYAGKPRRKRSPGKATWPGRKQVYRHYRDDGVLDRDVITLEDDVQPGDPLLRLVMRGGKRVRASPDIETLRTYAKARLAALPRHLRELDSSAEPYRVEIAPALQELAAKLDRQSASGQPLPANVMS